MVPASRPGMADVLVVTWDGGGNVAPFVGLASGLALRGHAVTVLGPSSLAGRFDGDGISFRDRTGDEWSGDACAADVVRYLEREPADVAVVDYMLPPPGGPAEAR